MQQKESKTNWHFYISLAKSVLRITAGIALYKHDIGIAGMLFIIAEILGIAEEL
jgi:hypothetical protein